jgi:regulator of protease activity HflC (stomatin/prohibitin superfamily)
MNYEIIAIAGIPLATLFAVFAALQIPKFRHVLVVSEGMAGLLCRHGIFVRRANAGRHVLWGRSWSSRHLDLRRTALTIAGQEALTSDGVSIKMSLMVSCRIDDPFKAVHESQNWMREINSATQIALHKAVGCVSAEALLNQRLEIGARLLARIQPHAVLLGIDVLAIEVKDMMLPAELRRAFAGAVKAGIEDRTALKHVPAE